MSLRIDSCPTIKNIELDFDEVETDATKIMSVKIVNQSEDRQTYYLQQDATSNTLDSVFHALDYSWSLEPSEFYVLDVCFRPTVSNRKYTEYFLILDTYNCCYRLTLRGCCIGPKVISCASRLEIISEHAFCRAVKSFKLVNSSNVPAKFMFDIDNDQGPFKVNEKSGLIKENSTKIIRVSFEPTGVGIYKFYLNCLVLHHDPITIELYGVSGVGDEKKNTVDFLTKVEEVEKLDSAHGFKNYMRDVTTSVKSDPPSISLSSNYIDFGHSETGCENFTRRTPQTISMTNHNQHDVFVTWDKDVCGAFRVQPREAKMRGNHTSVFEVRFDPTEDETFYSRELMARVFKLPCCPRNFQDPNVILMNFIPDFVSVRLIGHTFKRDLNNWIPQYDIHETIVMPASLPVMPTYTTFAIKSFGTQHLMFSFVPPDISHFNVKPMMGLISPQQEYQLITAQFFPEAEDNRAYVERWAIRLNGSIHNEIYVDFQGYAEQACLVFGDDNYITLDPIYVGCRLSQPIPVRNKTRHSIKFNYQVESFPDKFSVCKLEGIINPNELVMHDFILIPDEVKDYEFEIGCCISAEIGGRNRVVKSEVSAKSTEGSLMAVPEELNFSSCEFNKSKEMEFKIYNFSQVVINYLLACRSTKSLETLKDPERDVKLTPNQGSIRPGKMEKIKVIIHPSQPGFYELTIDYYIRVNSWESTVRPDIEPRSICTISCDCSLPSMQIKDLLYLAETNKEISKLSLWRSLNIDMLNSAVKSMLPIEETEIEMIVPFTNMYENEKFIVKLLLENSQIYDSAWIIKKKKTCTCKKVENKATMKKRKECLFCVHDPAFNVEPKDITLKTNETGVLTIEVRGNTLESSGICWKLDIGLRRIILLNIRLHSSIILSGSLLKFNTESIDQCSGVRYQAIWLFNNEEFESKYSIECKNLAVLNKENFGIVFTCLNPTGSIDGFTRKPVFFGFYPNKFGKFETTVTVRLDDKESVLKIEAEAVCAPPYNEVESESCPYNDTFSSPEIVAYFNVDCLVLPPLITCGKTTKLIMLHNHHLHDALYFEWQNYELPGVVKINVEPERGFVQPHSLLTLIVHIEAAFLTCSLEIDLICDFLDVSERSKLERRYRRVEDTIESMKDEFTITEKGITYPEKPLFQRSEKPATISKALTLKLKIYDGKSADLKVQPAEQLKKVPLPDIGKRNRTYQNDFTFELMKISSDIFEELIWEVVHSKVFSEIMKDSMCAPDHLKYSQLAMNCTERNNETEKLELRPSKRDVEDFLHSMISHIVHREFNLDFNHFDFPKDIRQSYGRTQPNIHRRSSPPGHITIF